MRRIVPKAEEERKRKRNNIFVGIVVIIVMLGSVFGVVVGYSGSPSTNQKGTEIEYNGQTFYNQKGFWVTQYRGLNMSFKYSPEQTDRVASVANTLNPLNSYPGKPLYIYSEDTVSRSEIIRNVGRVARRIQPICLNEENCGNNYPLKDCSKNTIIIKESSQNEINQTQKCVYIEGKSKDLPKVADEFVYRISGLK